MSLCVSIAGGDSRQFYMLYRLIEKLSENNISYFIKCYQINFPANEFKNLIETNPDNIMLCDSIWDLLKDCDILIGPVPFTRDGINMFAADKFPKTAISDIIKHSEYPKVIIGGNIPKYLINGMSDFPVLFKDIMKDKVFVKKNCALTAEGLLKYVIENTFCSIENAKILIAGYGRCGRAIADKLSVLGGHISVYDNDSVQKEGAKNQGYSFCDINAYMDTPADFNFIINTVPSPVFKAPFLRKLNRNCVLFDIASAPGGFDSDVCQGLALRVIKCPGIPGKTAPLSSGIAQAESIFDFLIYKELLHEFPVMQP